MPDNAHLLLHYMYCGEAGDKRMRQRACIWAMVDVGLQRLLRVSQITVGPEPLEF